MFGCSGDKLLRAHVLARGALVLMGLFGLVYRYYSHYSRY